MCFSKKALDIIIQGGQSNAEGTGLGPVDKAYIPNEKVFYLKAEKEVSVLENGLDIRYLNKPFTMEVAQERQIDEDVFGDFALTFSEEYINKGFLQEDRALLIIRGAIGGTGFQKSHWGIQDKVYLKMLEMVDYALSLNNQNKVVAFLWHQGEHDAFEGNTPKRYQQQLSTMLKDVRFRYGKMPFIAGDFVNEWKSKNLSSCEPIVDVIRRVIEDSEKTGFVETGDLLSNNQKVGNGDDIHFCRQSLHELGYRYFDAFYRINQ